MKRISKLAAALALAALALAGCRPPVDDGYEPPPIPEYTSPAKVLKAVQISFNQRNVAYLKASLSEGFVFYFDADDVGHNPPGGSNYVIPESWDYTVFWQAVKRLFENTYSVSLTISTSGLGEPDPNATTFKADNVNIKLLVMVDRVNGYISDQGYCNFEFRTYYNSTGTRLWRLVKWEDYTSVAGDSRGSPASASLGEILSIYK